MVDARPVFFDLQRNLKTNPAFLARVEALQNDIARARDDGDVLRAAQLKTKLIQECDLNPSLLLPTCFPNFQDGMPMTLWSRPHAFAMMALVPNGSITIAASRQIGKCVADNTEVTVCIGEEGSKKMSCKDLFSLARKKIACASESK